MIEDTEPRVKSKASTKFIERIAKPLLVKELSQRMAEV
jgi:hypothetical protein